MPAASRSIALAFVLSCACLAGIAGPASADDARAVVELSEREMRYFARQFRGKCALCHGKTGDGTGIAGAGAGAKPANFTDGAFMATRNDDQLFRQIRLGGEDESAMPAFGPGSDSAWSDEKIRKMVAFIRSFAPEASEPAALGAQTAPAAVVGDADVAAEGFEQVGPLGIVPVTVKPGYAFYSDDCGSRGRVRGLLEERNYEEVYQNYSYFEAWYDQAERVIEFREYRRGEVILTEKYSYGATGRLESVVVAKPGEKDERIDF